MHCHAEFLTKAATVDPERQRSRFRIGIGPELGRSSSFALPGWEIAGLTRCLPLFLQVAGDQLGHLEHADLLLAAEDGFEVVVGIDLGLLLVLQAVLLDVGPELLGQLGAGKGLVPDDLGERVVGRDGLHEGRVWCSFCHG